MESRYMCVSICVCVCECLVHAMACMVLCCPDVAGPEYGSSTAEPSAAPKRRYRQFYCASCRKTWSEEELHQLRQSLEEKVMVCMLDSPPCPVEWSPSFLDGCGNFQECCRNGEISGDGFPSVLQQLLSLSASPRDRASILDQCALHLLNLSFSSQEVVLPNLSSPLRRA